MDLVRLNKAVEGKIKDRIKRLSRTIRVHNEREADALIKEATNRGDLHEYDNSTWVTHSGDKLFTLKVINDMTGKVEKRK